MSQPKITIEKALTIFQNNIKGEFKIILDANNNQNPEAMGIYEEFYTPKSLLKYIAKNYGKSIVDFDLYFKPGTTLFKYQIYLHLKTMEKHLDLIKERLYDEIGDPGNDIGDAGTILELISNIITEDHLTERGPKVFYTTIGETEGVNLDSNQMQQIFQYFTESLQDADSKQGKAINEWATKF